MKLATYKDGSRDGQLVVVSRDLSRAHYASGIASKMQQVLDDWNFLSPQLQDLYDALNRSADGGSGVDLARHVFAFDPAHCMAPLPRAYQRLEGVACRQPAAPLLRRASDGFSGPCDELVCDRATAGLDCEAALAVITGDVARAATPAQALDGIRLLALTSDVIGHRLPATEVASDAGSVPLRCASSFSPVAVTPDECGSAWVRGRLHLALRRCCNGRELDLLDAAAAMKAHFGQLIAQACTDGTLSAGTIIGCGALGASCTVDMRAAELAQADRPATHFMQCGDGVRIEMTGLDGRSLFGAIEHKIAPPAGRGERYAES